MSSTHVGKTIVEAVFLSLVLLGTGCIAAISPQETNPSQTMNEDGPFVPDRSYHFVEENPARTGTTDNDDAGYKRDAGNTLAQAAVLYVGELVDDTPGRGRNGKLASSDTEDWYGFAIAAGQHVAITMTPPTGFDFDLALYDANSNLLQSSSTPGSASELIDYTPVSTMKLYIQVLFISGTGQGRYIFTIEMLTQNDANTGIDASNTMDDTAPLLTPGVYPGWLDMNDPYDWYRFQATAGQGIKVTLAMKDSAFLTDFDAQLYNPDGFLVYESNEYYDDRFEYPIDMTGLWFIRVDIFPGWVDCPQPTDWQYYSYGSGPYSLNLTLQSSAMPPPGPIPQPQITPIAKTFIVPNDPDSAKDEYGYLAAIPACNYLDRGRYLAPIIYTGDTTPTAYYDDATSFGTVDDTTQYLVDDWNAYLSTYGKTPVQYTVPADPVQAAADIATSSWSSATTAVVALDGSGYDDTTTTLLRRSGTMRHQADVETLPGDSDKIQDIGGSLGYPLFLGPKYGAINVSMVGNANNPSLGLIIPNYISLGTDWWPSPEDAPGDATDMYYPVTRAGIWVAGTDIKSNRWNFTITKYQGERYRFRVKDNDSVITAKLTTTEASDLQVFLVDPAGNLRSPDIPVWNGPVNPIHIWNGLENPPINPWRRWNPAPHTEVGAEVLHPETGRWTVIVVPRNANGTDTKFTLTVEQRAINEKRADAEVSAANAAVIASLLHAPLLYVTEDSVPTATANAFSSLGVTKVIFVERCEIGSAVRSKLPTIEADLKTNGEIVNEIKSLEGSENYITFTSLKTGGGFFAPAAMLAAYHGSPVLRIEEVPGNPAGVDDRIETWQLWNGDYYHGSRSTGHLPQADAPVEQNMLKVYFTLLKFILGKNVTTPTYGLDAKRYWNEEMVTAVRTFVDELGLDREGQEGYCFVAPRKDICLDLHSAMMGNNSYAGHIPGDTPAYTSAVVVRNILYPALIQANANRKVTTTQLMNYPDGAAWTTNDGTRTNVYASRELKPAFSSHFRQYEGHCLWDAHIERMNQGASVFYYSGHGTGGSGMSSQYLQTDDCNYPDQVWWDCWRGYMYDSWKMPRENGRSWFNPEPPMLYDIIHYKWIDQVFDNLRSNAVFYNSCTTADGDGPMVYLDHGAVCWYGNAGTGLLPEADLADDVFFDNTLVYGMPIGPAFANQVWLHYRDFTTLDNTSMYGPSSAQVTSIQCIYGDPALIVYSPDWSSPVPVDA